MKLQSLHIENFKSIAKIDILEPNPFTVFVGPNGSGKSNIFEALDIYANYRFEHWERFWGEKDKILNSSTGKNSFCIGHTLSDEVGNQQSWSDTFTFNEDGGNHDSNSPNIKQFTDRNSPIDNFWVTRLSRISISIPLWKQGNQYVTNSILSTTASNLEKVLKRILKDEVKREEFKEWLDLFIPGFENIEIISTELSGTDTLAIYEKGIIKPFTKDLLSDGTYNILALLSAVYQSDEPQFLCIEEPENGLHPQVIRELVSFFREACGRGHYIWLNTHSQTLVDCLTTDEIILVDKIKGETQIKQLKGRSLYNLPASELWLSGALGGGVTW